MTWQQLARRDERFTLPEKDRAEYDRILALIEREEQRAGWPVLSMMGGFLLSAGLGVHAFWLTGYDLHVATVTAIASAVAVVAGATVAAVRIERPRRAAEAQLAEHVRRAREEQAEAEAARARMSRDPQPHRYRQPPRRPWNPTTSGRRR